MIDLFTFSKMRYIITLFAREFGYLFQIELYSGFVYIFEIELYSVFVYIFEIALYI